MPKASPSSTTSSGRTNQEYELESPEGDQLLDALSILEIHGDKARDGLSEAKIGLSRLFPYFFKKKEEPATFVALAKCFSSQEKLGLQLRQEGLKVGVEGTIALVAESQQEVDWARVGSAEEMETKRCQPLIKAVMRVDVHVRWEPQEEGSFLETATEDERVEARSNALLRLARDHGSNFWVTEDERVQDRALQVREFLIFCTRTLSLVYGTMFPRNKMPETLPALMDKFRDAPRIHGFVRAQLAAGARFAMIMIKICYPKLDVGQVVPKCLAKMAKRKKNFSKYDDVVTPVAEDMMDELLRMDAEFFVKGS
ncbi:hypothetical protein QYE76_064077 [Lolium multiflorum]|uniref:Uncharacterized protein n=1 Tax=Lolium multiflorum TaxID=4521 RepID=A0AAD8S8K2_LOLMU|nr:hypothetical protein QYE76_064077 [Lolium multiflorum]